MNYISVCLLIFYSSLSFCQSYDKERSADFRRNSDSLIEVGKYEQASAYLSHSFSYQPKELRTKKYLKEYRKERSYLDSIIDCCVTDSMKCGYRLEQALYHIEKGSRSWAYTWIGKAERYCNDSEYFNSTLMKIFSPTKPDTIWASTSDINYNGFEIIRLNLDENKFYESAWHLKNLSNEIIHLRRDTSLFSGVVITKSDSYIRYDQSHSGSFEIWHFQNGKVKYHVDHLVKKDPEKNSITTSDPTGKLILDYFDDDFNYFYYTKYDVNGKGNKKVIQVEFYPNGDTLLRTFDKDLDEKEYKIRTVWFYPNGDTLSKSLMKQGLDFNYYRVSYHPEGDTSYYSADFKTDTNTLVREHTTWDKDNNKIFKSTWVIGVDKSTIFSKIICFNKYGDTTEYKYWVEGDKLQGIQYMPIYQLDYENQIEDDLKEPYILKPVFSKDSLQSILNRDIIYLDKRFRQISQSEYIELIAPVLSTGYEIEYHIRSLAESYEINGVTYNAIACFGLKGRIKKLRKKLKRME